MDELVCGLEMVECWLMEKTFFLDFFFWQSFIGSQVGQIFSISTSEEGSLGQKLKRQHSLRAVGPKPRNLLRAVGLYRTKFLADFDQAVLTGGLCRNKEQACSPTQKENLEKCHFSEVCVANSDMTSAKDCVSWHSLSHCGSVRDDTITRTEDISLRPFEPSNHEIAWNV